MVNAKLLNYLKYDNFAVITITLRLFSKTTLVIVLRNFQQTKYFTKQTTNLFDQKKKIK